MATECGMSPEREAELAQIMQAARRHSNNKAFREARQRADASPKPGPGRKVHATIATMVQRMCAEQFHTEYIARVTGASVSYVARIRERTAQKDGPCPWCNRETAHVSPQMCMREMKTKLVGALQSLKTAQADLAAAREETAKKRRDALKIQNRLAALLSVVDEVAQ